MKLIEQEHHLWGECPTNIEEAIHWIERAGRVCYRSEDKIIEGSGKKFVAGITKRGHWSVIEHSNLVVRHVLSRTYPSMELKKVIGAIDSAFLKAVLVNDRVYIGGNYRAHMEMIGISIINNLFEYFYDPTGDLEIVTNPEEIPRALKRVTVEFVTDRAVTHELVRHRPASYSQESQRYVRYNNIQFIKPAWYNNADVPAQQYFQVACSGAEEYYKWFIKYGKMKAEDARVVLPNCTATRIVVTASLPEWDIIFRLRSSKAAYPQIRNLILSVQKEFKEHGLL